MPVKQVEDLDWQSEGIEPKLEHNARNGEGETQAGG